MLSAGLDVWQEKKPCDFNLSKNSLHFHMMSKQKYDVFSDVCCNFIFA